MRALLAAVLVGASAVSGQPALASTGPAPGVHIDPRSPAGKQYEIPITSARGETSGGSRGSGSGAAPTFGSGVTPSASRRATATPTPRTGSAAVNRSTRARRGAHHQRRSAHHGTSTTGAPVTVATEAARQARTQANEVGSSSWLPLAGGGALVLLLGCGGGLALRRRG